jgi:hypothetical protein
MPKMMPVPITTCSLCGATLTIGLSGYSCTFRHLNRGYVIEAKTDSKQ